MCLCLCAAALQGKLLQLARLFAKKTASYNRPTNTSIIFQIKINKPANIIIGTKISKNKNRPRLFIAWFLLALVGFMCIRMYVCAHNHVVC